MTDTDFDSFDRALLTELREVAAEGAPTRVRRTRKRWAFAASGLAAAAVTTIGVTSLGSSAAYAVEETGSGAIVITIRELDDADGLEEALADHGIAADVDYQSDGFGSGPEDGQDIPDGADVDGHAVEGEADVEKVEEGAEVDQAVPGEPPANDPCGGFDNMPFTTELSDDDYVITIPADSVLKESDTVLRITTSGDVDDQAAALDVAYSVGDVDCGFGTASVGTPPN
ncbi:hypothetical protein SFC88_03245 [Nocardioides sp. HM23]|uniref:hypothetical protein n=1 Tax=Nocardioides bizhenqiangii TaxID=3095076 RepID=UPI002ACA9C68|nr:hypothetical protein [Nocardioides sp. HM23]MDZ5619823.1 hypothetical protein [Nocardioides sp. HM23]